MIDIQRLIELDQHWLLSMNGSSSMFIDSLMFVFSSTQVWIPLAVVLLYVLLRNNSLQSFFLVLLSLALTIILCDQIASGFCKPFFARWRPTQDPSLMYMIDIVNGYRGGKYGFISSHASNTFGVFMFLTLLFKNARLSFFLFTWAFINGYSRIYLGVHYPGDVVVGSLLGILVGLLVYWLYVFLYRKMNFSRQCISDLYTSGGYLVSDMNFLTMFLLLTYLFIPLIGILITVTKNF